MYDRSQDYVRIPWTIASNFSDGVCYKGEWVIHHVEWILLGPDGQKAHLEKLMQNELKECICHAYGKPIVPE